MSTSFVVDTSVLVQSIITDDYSHQVAKLLKLVADNVVTLHIPNFCLIECANVVWKRVKFHDTPVIEAKTALNNLLNMTLTIHDANDYLPRALEIAVAFNLAIYDSIHIAVAEKLHYPLITVDVKQASIVSSVGVSLKSINDFSEA